MWVRADWVSLFSVSMAGRSSTFLFNMAASSASKKVFELFVSKVPWSLANRGQDMNILQMTVGIAATQSEQGLWVEAYGQKLMYHDTGSSEELKEYFSQFGTVKKCLLPFDRETGFHRGYCWIKFASEEGLQNALQKESHIIEGSKIQMQINRKPQGMYTNNRSGNDLG